MGPKRRGLGELTRLETGWCGPVCDPPTQLLKPGSPLTCLGQSNYTWRCCRNGSPRLRHQGGKGVPVGIKHRTWALVKFTSSQDLPTKGGTGELERATSKVRGKELRQKQVPWTEAEALAVCKLGSMNLLPTKCLCTIAPSALCSALDWVKNLFFIAFWASL